MALTGSEAAGTDVIVVGGGIGGLAAAYSLARRSLRVRVLEQASAFGEVGPACNSTPTEFAFSTD